MAKTPDSPAPSTYVTGFCSVGRHERCPAVIKNNVGGQVWECHCPCHAEGNTGWEPKFDWVANTVDAINGSGDYATSGDALRVHESNGMASLHRAHHISCGLYDELRHALERLLA